MDTIEIAGKTVTIQPRRERKGHNERPRLVRPARTADNGFRLPEYHAGDTRKQDTPAAAA